MNAHFAVVVATRDRGAKIAPLIESVLANTRVDFEMIVVDQSANDDTERAIAPFLTDTRLRYVRSSERGVSRGRNQGIAATTAPIIAITDDDCVVGPDWLAGIAIPFEENPRVGLQFCSVKGVPDDRPGLTPEVILTASRIVRRPATAWRLATNGLMLGAAMNIRRSMLDDVAGFDELVGPGARFGACEDNDLSWRGMYAGWWTYHNADVTVLHDGFRNLDEVRELVIRDFFGVGGVIAKYLKCGRLPVLTFLVGWLIRFGIVGPLSEALAGRKPTGLRRPYMLVRGVIAGLRTAVDHDTITFIAPSLVPLPSAATTS